MKVAIDVLSQSPGHSTGALSWFLQFAGAAPRRDPVNDYVLIAGHEDAAYYQAKNPETRVIGAGWGNARRVLRVLSEHFLLAPVLWREKADILFHGGSGVAPLILPRGIKLVLAVWGMQHVTSSDIRWEQKLYRRLFFRPGLRRANRIVVNSVYTRNLLLAHYAGDIRAPVEVVHHGVDLSLFRPGPLTPNEQDDIMWLSAKAPYVLFVGQAYPYKLLHVLARAFCRAVVCTGLPHRLVVVGSFDRSDSMGDSYRREIEAIMREAGLGDRLVLLEHINIAHLRAAYAGASLYVQPSAAETFGRTVIEAMACGVPVLAAHAGATPEILADAGRYYEALDVEGCAREIVTILQDEVISRDLITRGLIRARNFSYDLEVDRLVSIFHDA